MYVINHLAMSGAWLFRNEMQRMTVHTRLAFRFTDPEGQHEFVDFTDPRHFGRLDFHSSEEFWGEKIQNKLGALGPDAIFDTITYQMLVDQTHKFTEKHPEWEIKPLLMEQQFLSGIGNYLASDICFLAGINPFKKAGELSVQDLKNLEESIPSVVKTSYEQGGSTIRTYKAPDGSSGYAQRMVYGQKYCRLCNTKISKCPQAGRTTHWCPKCQPM